MAFLGGIDLSRTLESNEDEIGDLSENLRWEMIDDFPKIFLLLYSSRSTRV